MDISKSLAQPSSVVIATATAGVCTATATKSANDKACIYITGFIISGDTAPAAKVEATITGTGVTIPIEIPAAAFAPITKDFSTHPLKCTANTDAVLSVPSLGSGVKCGVSLFYFYGPA